MKNKKIIFIAVVLFLIIGAGQVFGSMQQQDHDSFKRIPTSATRI